jgi:hypothetical protein
MSLLCFERNDIVQQKQTSGPDGASRAAFLTRALWRQGSTIRIFFIEPVPDDLPWQAPFTTDPEFLDPLYETLQGISKKNIIQPEKGLVDPKTLVRRVVEERIAPYVNLKFEFVTDPAKSDIRILFRKGIGCSSVVGVSTNRLKFSQGGENAIQPKGEPEPTMTYGWLDVSTVLHEFCHALGMIHEHQNPKGNPIQWNNSAVYCHFKKSNPGWSDKDIDKNILEPYDKNRVNGSEFDPASIMIYSFPETVECNKQSLPLTLNSPPLKVNPNYKLSNMDIEILKEMYPFGRERNVENVENKPFVQTTTYQIPGEWEKVKDFIRALIQKFIALIQKIIVWIKALIAK